MKPSRIFIIAFAGFLLWKYFPSNAGNAGNAGATGAQFKYDYLIEQAKAEYPYISDVPIEIVRGIIMAESSAVVGATGQAGETGLMQLMPPTWTWITSKFGLPSAAPYHEYHNIVAGMHVFKVFSQEVGSWSAGVHAYNVGASGYRQGRRNWPYYFKVMGF